MAFRHLQAELAEREKAIRVAIAEAGSLQALLDTEKEISTSSPTLERELVCLHHLHGRLREVANFGVAGLLHTHPSDDLILHSGFGMLFRAVSDHLCHV